MDRPVLIAGAGPVGLTMAMALKRQGVALRIIDKAAARSDKSKALVLWPRTLEMLDIQGCVQPFIETGMKATGVRILDRHHTLVHVRLDAARSRFPYALMLPQSDTERLLEEQLALLGVHVERHVELVSFTDNKDIATAALRHADGSEENTDYSYLAACDGAHSTIRHGLAVQFDGDTLPSDWLLADVELDGDLPNDELTICWTPDGVLALIPIRGARFRVIADLGHASAQNASAPTLVEVQSLLDERGPTRLSAHDPVWTSRFRINERKVNDYRHGRIFLCGDAAHIHSPAGGQGMNTGMQDVINLAWKLAMVWHGRASSELLESYSPERSAIGEQVLRNAGTMTKVAIVRNPILQEIRNLAVGALGRISALRQILVDQLTEVDLHYHHSPLTRMLPSASPKPAPGERAPDLPVNHTDSGATRLHEVLADGKFALLSVSAPTIKLPDALKAIATTTGTVATDDYRAGYIYLIRPDAYVAMSTKTENRDLLLAELQAMVGTA
ncbi:monooxygenase [Pollutimonas subterranea]|uniref:Monooxygenase n=1 Tax=Pollutimonas subterranea TaxID=2045210 RepID=A0A2N4U292_9BURK|nr:FAD-dependent monooxygenase [Pollutimonas subterranea]PLC49123.1 monooxygenase [Pollutimonas subterranea]